EEVYMAVVESELELLSEKMRRVGEEVDVAPDFKLMQMIYTRLDGIKESVYRNGTLRADFFRDIWRVEKVRKRFDATEVQLFKDVLREGMEKGTFLIDDLDMTAEIVHYCVKGIEVPYIRGQIGAHLDINVKRGYVARLVLRALGVNR
ncbi:MAG: TetR family transcriptional regulator, partial [Prevotellaceae bacterium]|nr:TetR family transcriptional regulator [Prevotellaceae bacterium]